ncbi:unnamed protein product [Thlaspi arvense]|uniref:RING-type E3 ubiquitin transferase n=1 Tax=Thlaspi arvense TaxID=13288 RepID=A0AAU9R6S4_THLAR|nr:unnamed protein product [Thlaspi arvense]
MNSQRCSHGDEEKRVLDKSRSLLNWLTQRNFEKIKDEIVQTIRRSPSALVIKSLVCCIFDMAMVDNAYVLFARLCVELFHALPSFPSDGEITTFGKLFFRKCRMELERSSPETDRPPLVFVEESDCWRFIKTVRLLAEIFKNRMLTESTRQSIIQVLMNPIFPPERNTDAMNYFLSSIGKLADFQFCDESFKQLLQNSQKRYDEQARVKKEAEEALARKNEELEVMKRLLESYKEEQGLLLLQAQESEQNHQKELLLRKATECALAIQRETIDKAELRLETLEIKHDNMCSRAEELESKYEGELLLRKESETALAKEMNALEEMKQLLETCKIEQENLSSQVRTWQDKYEQESSLRKETEDALSREKRELLIVKGLLESFSQAAALMRQERDDAQKTEVMEDPHIAADGFTYEAESIKKWLSTGHDTSPMTNLKLSHRTLIPNRALRSAIEEFV